MKRDVIGLILLLVALVLLAWVIFASPADAHTAEEIEQWEIEWEVRVDEVATNLPLDPWSISQLLQERADFISRHQCHYVGCAPAPAPVRSGGGSRSGGTDRSLGSDVEQWRGLVAQYFGAGEVDTALCLMRYESGGNPNTKNPRSSARGLMQILASTWAPHFGVSYEALYDPATNLSIAAQIQDMQGWWAWSPYNRGLCR